MKRPLGVLALTAGMTLSSLAAALAADIDVTFLLISDIYEMASADSQRGGFARVNALAKAERAKGGNLVYVHAGDFISPSILSGFDKGEHVVALTNVAPPDIVVPGNHEFDFGKEIFLKRIGEVNATILSANLRQADGSPVPGIDDTRLMTFGDAADPMKSVSIGFVGLTLEDSPILSSPGDLRFASTMETAAASAASLRDAGADIVVAVVHEAFSTDQKLYGSGDFDFVLSGHDHDLALLYNGKAVMAESRSEGDLIVAVDVRVSVGKSRGRRRVTWWPNFRIIDSASLTPDPVSAEMVAKYQASLSAELDVPVGTTETELDSRKTSVRTSETAIGNLIADAMKKAVGADIAIANGGGIRGDREYEAGTVLSRRDILTELPFGNKTLLLEIDGAALMEALEHGVSGVERSSGRFPQVAGMRLAYDPTKPVGARISEVTVAGAPLDPARTYQLATNDYIAGGGDGYAALRRAKVRIDGLGAKLVANDVMSYIRDAGSVAPKVEGRITTAAH